MRLGPPEVVGDVVVEGIGGTCRTVTVVAGG